MFDIGGAELLLIGIVTLIVVQPKDLPQFFVTVGRMVGRLKGYAVQFQEVMEQAAETSGVNDIKKEVNALRYDIDEAVYRDEGWTPPDETAEDPLPSDIQNHRPKE